MKYWICISLCVVSAGCATVESPSARTKDAAAEPSPVSVSDQSRALNHYLTSVIFMNTGQYEDAIKEMRKSADLTPDSEALQVRLLAMYYRDQDYDNAATMAERTLKQHPENVTMNIWLGRIYYQLDRIDDATEAFQKAISLDPSSSLGYEALVEVEEQSNDLIGAIDVYEQLIELTPDSEFLHYRLGVNLLEMDDVDGGRAALEKALSLNPNLAPASFMLGLAYLEHKEYDKAIERFEAFLKENTQHTNSWENMAGAYVQKGDYESALDIITRIIESDSVNTQHHLYRSYVHLRRGNVKDSSVALAPNGAPILGTLLQALVRRQASEPYKKLVESLDDIDSDLDLECNLYLNDLISRFSEDEEGAVLEAELRSLLDEQIVSKSVGIVLGRLLMATEQNAEAVIALEHVLSEYGADKWLHYYLATANDELKNHSGTEKHLRACLEFDPNDPDNFPKLPAAL